MFLCRHSCHCVRVSPSPYISLLKGLRNSFIDPYNFSFGILIHLIPLLLLLSHFLAAAFMLSFFALFIPHYNGLPSTYVHKYERILPLYNGFKGRCNNYRNAVEIKHISKGRLKYGLAY